MTADDKLTKKLQVENRELRRRLDEAEAEIKELNAGLSTRITELENLNRELEAFIYMASHDLRRPLNNIFTSTQAVEQLCGDMLDGECMELLEIIRNGALNMSSLIGKLLSFSCTGNAELRREPVGLSDMARVAIAELRLKEPERAVKLRIDDGVVVNGDPELLRLVLDNLLENAWKSTVSQEQATIEFGSTDIDGKQTCYVRDNGPGFDMREAEGLFLPFRRLPGSKSAGHGIGLATVERVIRRHGGNIWASAEPGKGATFFFTLGG